MVKVPEIAENDRKLPKTAGNCRKRLEIARNAQKLLIDNYLYLCIPLYWIEILTSNLSYYTPEVTTKT